MNRIELGKTGIEVSRLAVGCWQLSPQFWGDIDRGEWEQAMRAAGDAGINFVDTADAYGEGYAEEVLGRYFKTEGNRDHWVLATKFYWDLVTPVPEDYVMKRFPNTTREYIVAACEASLKRLQTDVIDLYQLHSWDPLMRPEEVAAAIDALKRAGKIRHFGVSNLNAEQMRMLGRCVDVETLQPKYNLLHRAPEQNEFPYCVAENIGVLAYSPLERGLFSGKVTTDSTFADHRGSTALFQRPSLEKLVPKLDLVAALAESLGLTLPEFAIRWVLSHPAATVALIGTKKAEHVTGLLRAADEPLPAPVWHEAAARLAA